MQKKTWTYSEPTNGSFTVVLSCYFWGNVGTHEDSTFDAEWLADDIGDEFEAFVWDIQTLQQRWQQILQNDIIACNDIYLTWLNVQNLPKNIM